MIQAVYFKYNKDWYPLHVGQLVYCAIFCVLLVKFPESPKFLYTNRRFDEARATLKEIAKTNGNKLSS